jgi:serine/threonine-protein kinase
LGGEIGRGGMGVVYRATRLRDGAAVAVKTITPAPGVGARQVEKFVREARVMARLSHPNITAYLDSGAADPLAYLVMELVDGPDAGRVLRARGPLPVPTAVRIACGLLAGLAHAHAGGVVHRDVKPSNVLLGGARGRRVVKVADFGLARAYDDCRLSGLTMQGEVGGTPAFMAPEQVTHFRDVKPAADQYAAAATLYNLLTAAYPHDLPRDVGRQLGVIVNGRPVPVASRRPGLPPGLVEVIHRALEREPDQRFPHVTAFRAALLPFAS